MDSEHNGKSSRPSPFQNYLQSLPVIEKSWAKDYRKRLDILYRELVRLNSYIYIMEKIAAFRFDLFVSGPNYYWGLTFASMYETCLSILWRTACDRNKQTLTVLKLKTAITNNLVDDESGDRYRVTLKEANFEDKIANIRNNMKKQRDHEIAHLNLERFTEATAESLAEARLHLQNISKIAETVCELFKLLCIGEDRQMTLGRYGVDIVNPADTDGRSDIEELLDLVARESDLLKMPEEQPDFWPKWRKKHLSSGDIDIVDAYRKKFDLPPVPR